MEFFRTIVTPNSLNERINYQSKILCLGSCFTQSIGSYFQCNKFNIDINPFGVQYNPLSIASSMTKIIDNKQYEKGDLFFEQERWHSFDHHSDFSDADINRCLENINKRVFRAHQNLSSLTHLMLTFGTNFYFLHKSDNKIVSNCHKVSSKEFERIEMSVELISKEVNEAIHQIKLINPNIRVIYTVSPIRYTQQGFAENTISKGKLFSALSNLLQIDSTAYYFPAYEIMMDELRDYRFYKEDMIHPSDEALRYIWQNVVDSMIEPNAQALMKEIHAINLELNHRPYQPESTTHQAFLKKLENKIKNITERYPFLNYEQELKKLVGNNQEY
jgi:GSCFA family